MINHIRTLLLNSDTNTGAPWDRYLPAEFKPVNYSQPLESARRYILGLNLSSEPWTTALRLEEILTILFSGRYDEYAYMFGNSITAPGVPPAEFAVEREVSSNELGQSTNVQLTVNTDRAVYDVKRYWSVTYTGSKLFVQYKTKGTTAEFDLTTSLAVELAPGVSISFSGLPAAGSMWEITVYAQVPPILSAYSTILRELPRAVIDNLFNYTEQKGTLLKLEDLFYSRFADDVIAGFTLAFAIQAHDAYTLTQKVIPTLSRYSPWEYSPGNWVPADFPKPSIIEPGSD